jgi:hypothetical protein
MLIELYSDGTVKGKMNDNLVILAGCTTTDTCSSVDFLAGLEKLIYEPYMDMKTTCDDLTNLKSAALQ